MKKLNIYLALIALVLCVVIIIRKNDLTLTKVATLMAISTPTEVFDFHSADSLAKQKLKSKFIPTPAFKIPGLDGISYDDYRQIEYKPDVAIWKNLALPYQLHFFHPGHIYSNGIQIYEVINEKPVEIPYDASRFNFGDLPLSDDFAELTQKLHYTGFRVHYPINQKDALEEFLVFQGASYFRAISKDQVYGLSGRGLAINTGPKDKEEFPIFESFYIKRPQKTDTSITIYAIMNSESVVGSYEFVVKPGEITTIDVRAKIYLRKKIKRLGFAPITSMYLYGESDNPILGNIHPEVHDSDGLLVQTKTGDWEWRPLINPKKTQLTRIQLDSPSGYGLIQRDRKFKSYQDEKLQYHLRPSVWVEPKGNWGKGSLYLLEFTTNLDSDDNVTTFWEPAIPPNLNEGYEFQYTLHYTDRSPKHHTLGKASAFYRGVDPVFPKEKVFTLYFTGDYLKSLDKKTILSAVIKNSEIPPEQIRYKIEKITELDQWRLQIWYPSSEGNQIGVFSLEWKIKELRKHGFIEMDYPNNTIYLNEFSERIRSYLILSGIHNEYKIAEVLNGFFKSTDLSFVFESDWKLWLDQLGNYQLELTQSLPLPDRSWQFGSMIPQSADWKRDTQKTKQSIVGSLKPVFIIASIFLWSFLYYIIIFRLL